MKKTILTIIISIATHSLFACDVCGCSSGNYFLGPTPQFNKHFIGMRYSFRSFKTVLKNDATQFSNDLYQTTEIWGGFKIKKRFQVLAFLPYNFNHSLTDDGTKTNNGFGDATTMFFYNLFNKNTLGKKSRTINQQLWVGIGIKTPTGKFIVDTTEIVSSANNQVGTGTFDFLFNTSYTLVVNNFGISSNANYKINRGTYGFRFGNRFAATAFVFRSFHFKQNSIYPNLGLLFENLSKNEFANTKIEATGGYDLLGAIGIETRFNKIIIGCNIQLPITSNISNTQTIVKTRSMAHVSYLF